MPLSVTRNENEEWRDCVIRYAQKVGLATEALWVYDDAIRAGLSEADAAWNALSEWDLLDYRER